MRKPAKPSTQALAVRGIQSRMRKLANRVAKLMQLGDPALVGWSETSRGKCRRCKVGDENSAHTLGVRRFRHSRNVLAKLDANLKFSPAGVVSGDEICASCLLREIGN